MRIRLVIFNNKCSFIYLFVIEHLLLKITRIWFIHVGAVLLFKQMYAYQKFSKAKT